MDAPRRALRTIGSPVRRYLNGSVESVKDEVRRVHTDEHVAADRRHDELLLAVTRLEEAIGFLGLQLTLVRNEIDDLRVGGAPASTAAAGAEASGDAPSAPPSTTT